MRQALRDGLKGARTDFEKSRHLRRGWCVCRGGGVKLLSQKMLKISAIPVP